MDAHVAAERERRASADLGGRTVFDDRPAPARRRNQLGFDFDRGR